MSVKILFESIML